MVNFRFATYLPPEEAAKEILKKMKPHNLLKSWGFEVWRLPSRLVNYKRYAQGNAGLTGISIRSGHDGKAPPLAGLFHRGASQNRTGDTRIFRPYSK